MFIELNKTYLHFFKCFYFEPKYNGKCALFVCFGWLSVFCSGNNLDVFFVWVFFSRSFDAFGDVMFCQILLLYWRFLSAELLLYMHWTLHSKSIGMISMHYRHERAYARLLADSLCTCKVDLRQVQNWLEFYLFNLFTDDKSVCYSHSYRIVCFCLQIRSSALLAVAICSFLFLCSLCAIASFQIIFNYIAKWNFRHHNFQWNRPCNFRFLSANNARMASTINNSNTMHILSTLQFHTIILWQDECVCNVYERIVPPSRKITGDKLYAMPMAESCLGQYRKVNVYNTVVNRLFTK